MIYFTVVDQSFPSTWILPFVANQVSWKLVQITADGTISYLWAWHYQKVKM